MSRLGAIASLAGAITDTESPVGLIAEAVDVSGGALVLLVGNGGHVVDAELSA